MDDAALIELPDDPIALRRIILDERTEHAAAIRQRDTVITRHEQAIRQHDTLIAQHDSLLTQRDESLRQRDESLRQRDESLRQRDESIELLSQDNQLLRHRLAALLRSSYGPRAERFDPRQLLLFGLLVPPIEPASEDPQADKPRRQASPKRHKHGRGKLPPHLPRIPIEHDLSEAEKTCPCCGKQRQHIGSEKTEQLEHVPSNFVVVEHLRHKYACPHCNAGQCQQCDGKGQIAIAAKAAEGADKCLAGPGLLAHVVTSKMADHLPLYRIEQIFSRQQVNINRSTLSGWMDAAARVVEPLYRLMCDRVKQSEVLHTDDTTVPIQHLGHCRTGRLWTYLGDEFNPYIVYDYTPTRSSQGGQGPLEWLGSWKGFLQADAYAGYDKLFGEGRKPMRTPGEVIEVACWAHTRRKFFEAQESDPARALWMLEMIRRLYAVEAEARDRPPPDRLRLRQSQSVPILEQIRLWLIDSGGSGTVLPRSPIAGAIGYALNQWPALCVYTTDARLSIDNNAAERALRRVAVGRKNWLFAGHDASAKGQAVLWSLIASAQRHGLDVQLYLRSVLAHLPALAPDELSNYLPDLWKRDLMAEQQAALKAHHAALTRTAHK